MREKSFHVSPELEDVANQVGEFIEYWGFKNVHGRIWTHLFLAQSPLDAGELIRRLQISKALVSMSISDLLAYDVVRVAGKGQRGSVTYEANPDLTAVITNVLRQRERRMLGRISTAVRQLKDLPENARGSDAISEGRIATLATMVGDAELGLDAMLRLTAVDFKCWEKFTQS